MEDSIERSYAKTHQVTRGMHLRFGMKLNRRSTKMIQYGNSLMVDVRAVCHWISSPSQAIPL